MALIFITGNSGAGKSAVRAELQRRGYEAHDTDENDLSTWRHKVTDEIVARPEDVGERTKEWYDKHDWKMSRQKVEELAKHAKNKLIFLCGSPSNADEMFDLYEQVVCLTLDKTTLQNRLASRPDEDAFGKAPDELKNILGWHDSFENRYRQHGATMVEASKPLREVVDDVLDQIASSKV